ncbi:flagellar basal body P-ring formation chaperone FlgA [Rhodospira trueperi]|uniref:Flagella basal body P-ring formation protein FlgA n=1 Tax=Rhodospira trueperi TaxID=69960 RepID=A0A1G7A696_9PROT|nr:flagellar basal body P-ring formation chaperone FlgA [Rhodospira trueperi]SDE10291.1 flagella basal body P-ring formation protein FlgA [Rhodospira trueperi]
MIRSMLQSTRVSAVALCLVLLVPVGAAANEIALPATGAGRAPADTRMGAGSTDIAAFADALVDVAQRTNSTVGAVAALGGIPGAGGVGRAALRPETMIEQPYMVLGDLFVGLPVELSAVPIGYAPPPGERMVLDARYLNDLAVEYGVPWEAPSRFVRAVVERRGYDIGRSHVLEALRDHLLEAGMSPNAEVDISALNIHATVGSPDQVRVEVRDLYYDSRAGRFSARVDVPSGGGSARTVRLTGSVHVAVDVPVLNRPLRSGMVVTEDDIGWDTMRQGDLRPDILLDPHDLIGKATRRGIQAGQPVRASQVTPPEMVSRNAPVTMTLETPFMTVTARGRALEDGAIGETVRVANLGSGTEVLAVVSGRNAVRVRTEPMPVATR